MVGGVRECARVCPRLGNKGVGVRYKEMAIRRRGIYKICLTTIFTGAKEY